MDGPKFFVKLGQIQQIVLDGKMKNILLNVRTFHFETNFSFRNANLFHFLVSK